MCSARGGTFGARCLRRVAIRMGRTRCCAFGSGCLRRIAIGMRRTGGRAFSTRLFFALFSLGIVFGPGAARRFFALSRLAAGPFATRAFAAGSFLAGTLAIRSFTFRPLAFRASTATTARLAANKRDRKTQDEYDDRTY